ncbi:MAG: TolC family protein [Deltaproteobacteria bacterium]|nr:TolC family protein [Deltaproteobacteria bacterium]
MPKKIIAVILMVLGFAAQAAAGNHSRLNSLVDIALRDNPELQAAKAKWQMYANRIIPAASLDDPTLSLAFNNYPVDKFRGDETPMTGKVFKLSQKFPFPGKLAAKEDSARQLALWYKGVYEDNRLALARQVKDVYFKLYYLGKAIQLTKKNAGLLQDFTKVTETRYEVGKGLQQDVLKAQVERSKLSDRLLILDQKQKTAMARLNTMLNRPPDWKVPAIPKIPNKKITQTVANLEQQAPNKRPLFAAYKSLMASYKAKKALARLNYRPDFKAGLAYTFREHIGADQGTDFAGIQFGMNLPIFTAKRDSAQADAEAGLLMVRHRYQNFHDRVNFDIDDAWRDIQKNRQQADLYKNGIIPQASQTLEASISAYEVGKVSFLTLLDNLMTLYRYEIDYHRALSDGLRAVARLEAASGVQIL